MAAHSEGTGSVFYFAIGAMLNPVSLANRKIFPLESRPAELLDHNIHFFGSIGVAEAVVEEGASFHGVLHKLDAPTMAKLDKIERDYVKKTATARCYDGTLIECLVYCRPHSIAAVAAEAAVEEESSKRNVPVMNKSTVAVEEAGSENSCPMSNDGVAQSRVRKDKRRSLCLSDLRISDSIRTARLSSVSSLPSHRRMSLDDFDTSGFFISPCVVAKGDGNDGDDISSSETGSDTTPSPSNHTTGSPTHFSDQPPLERYLDIMIDGCHHFGVSEEYINFLRNHESQPRPIPGEFVSFGEPPKDSPTLTLQEVEQCNGRDGRALRITFCGRVLECSLDHASQDWKEFVELHDQVGHVGELYISRVAYDPKYGVPEHLEDFTEEHANYLEDLFWRYMAFTGLPGVWHPVAWFEQTYKE